MTAHAPFWARVAFTADGCWEWQGAKQSAGYGLVGRGGRMLLTHRRAYELVTGETIPPGLTIDHLCRNRDCCNPDHMEIVSRAENGRRGERVRTVRRGGNSH